MSVHQKTRIASPFPIVGIGASAGGLEAFRELLKNLPPDTGMAFVLVQHLDPTHPSLLTEIISSITKMPTLEVKNRMPVKPNCVYTIPPIKDMTVSGGKFCLVTRPKRSGSHLPVDRFFISLAKDRGDQAIGVILSGAASDGVIGQKAIKAKGGITFSQDPASAKQDGMPKAAIAAGAVDYILRPKAIAEKLVKISQHLPLVRTASEGLEKSLLIAQDDMERIFIVLKYAHGVDFRHYKRTTVERRIKRRLSLTQKNTLKEYLKFLQRTPKEGEFLFQDLLINVTSFFRDPVLFKTLEKKIFPEIFKLKKADEPLRIWVPACSTGEEAYSFAICLLEALGGKDSPCPLQVFATDVNEAVIRKARRGWYPQSIKEDMPAAILERYFDKEAGGYRIIKPVRSICVFAAQDLTRDSPFSRLDVVSCRNMLIYMDLKLQKKIIPLFHYALNPSGFLILGPAESISGFANLFNVRDKKLKIYTKKESSSRPTFNVELGRDLLTSGKPAQAFGLGVFEQPLPFAGQDEDAQARDEELRSALEEIQSANEELQSSNEELETSKEELQATNEELVTLNDELSNRNAELATLTGDIQNLFNSTRLPVIMVGRDLCVHRFTPTAQKVWNLIPSDVGRKLADINPNFKVGALDEMLKDAIDHLKVTEKEVQGHDGRWHLMVVSPYKTVDNKIDGAVIVLGDIHSIKTAQQKLEALGEYFKSIVEAVPDPMLVLDKSLRVRTANKAFYSQFKVRSRQTEGELFYDLGDHQWDIPPLRKLLKTLLTKKISVVDFEVCAQFPGLGERTILLNARIIDENVVGERMVLMDLKDVTEKKKAEENILRLSSFPELNPNPIYEIDLNGKIVYANRAALKLKEDGLPSPVRDKSKEIVEVFRRSRKKELVREVRIGERWYLQSIYSVPGVEGLRTYHVDITKRKQALEALEFQQTFLSSVLEHIDAAVVACNEKGELVLFNRLSREWHGLNPMKIPQAQWAHRYNLCLEDGATLMDTDAIPLMRAFRGETVRDVKMVIAAKGQFLRHILAHAGPVKAHDGRVLGAVAIMHDITEHRKSEEKYRTILQTTKDGFFLAGIDGQILDVNDAYCAMIGYSREELLGMGIKDVEAIEAGEEIKKHIHQIMQKGSSLFETKHRRKDGRVIDIEASVNLFKTGKEHLFVFVRDITERKRIEESFREAKHFNDEVISAAGEGIIVYDAQLCYQVWNPQMERLTGMPAVQVLGKKASDLFPHLMDQGIDKLLARALAGETVISPDTAYRVANTEKMGWVHGIYTPHRDNKGNIIGVIAMIREITERKHVEGELKVSKEQAEEASRYKTEFLTNISHDLRTPLNAILGFAHILKSVEMEPRYRKSVDFINERGKHLLAMVEEILHVSRMDSGTPQIKSVAFDLTELLENSIEVARVGLGAKDVKIALITAPTIPRLKGDVLRIRQIIDNLLSNAVKYTLQGEIKVSAVPDDRPSSPDKYRAEISVKDTGFGIPAEKLPYIFDSFTRFHEFYKGQTYDGVGLGLNIVKKQVDLLGGRIRVLSEVDKGSEFILTLDFDKV